MPELPEVETVARDLRRLIAGAEIAGARVSWDRTLRNATPEAFAIGVVGRRIEAVGRRAKLLVVVLSGDAALTVHLKMTGQLFVVPADAPEDRYVRLVLAFTDGRELRFRDIRKFGKVGLYRRDPATGELHDPDVTGGPGVFATTGPEPLDPGFTLSAFRRRLRSRRGRLKPLILDQAFLAGVGNIYADEALWEARLHPLRSAPTLRPPDQARLFRAIRRILAEAVEHRGSSVDDYTAPDGDGSMQDRLRIYQRTGDGCPRCGRPVRRIVVGARSTHFCSWCQRLPALDRAGAAATLRTMVPKPGRSVRPRRGRRWSELGRGAEARPPTGPAEAVPSPAERARRAAATRRAAARTAVGATGSR